MIPPPQSSNVKQRGEEDQATDIQTTAVFELAVQQVEHFGRGSTPTANRVDAFGSLPTRLCHPYCWSITQWSRRITQWSLCSGSRQSRVTAVPPVGSSVLSVGLLPQRCLAEAEGVPRQPFAAIVPEGQPRLWASFVALQS